MSLLKYLARATLLLTLLLSSGPLLAQSLRIAAASDLRFALDEIVALWQQQQPDTQVQVIYGSSGKLTTQIINGAPFDLLFAADIAFAEQLHERGLTSSEPQVHALGRIVLWSNTLDAGQLSLTQLSDPAIRRIAIAQPAHAPYGLRAQEALQAAGVWEAVEPKLVFAENIAHAAQMAQSGAAQVGIIAMSLAMAPGLAEHPYLLIDDALHSPLLQGYVITRRAADKPQAQAFVAFIESPEVHAIMRRYGFLLPGEQP